jgi:hypothetical protein
MESAAYVPQNALRSSKVRFPRAVHVGADLLNGVGDVRPGEGEVLEGSSQAAEVRGILNRGAISGGQLGLMSTGVVHGLQSAMPARAKMSSMY